MPKDAAVKQEPWRVVLVDDHTLVRHGVASLLHTDGHYVVVGEAADGESCLQLLEQCEADIVLLDLSMPRLNGLETMRRMQRRLPRLPVIILSMYNDEQFVRQVLQEGARGYILKNAMDEELFHALHVVLHGGKYFSSSVDPGAIERNIGETLELTVREREVLQLIAEGHTTQEVADLLVISPHTATRHRANLMQKLGAHSQVELLRAATARGLILIPRTLEA